MTSMWIPAPSPKTELGRYRILSELSGLRVSPLGLGAASLGSAWEKDWGQMSKEDAFQLLDHYIANGGNFIDTANVYQDEQSETWIGEWLAKHQNRDLLVIATKYATNYRSHRLGAGSTVNYSGNHRKSMFLSVRDSLKKLQTDYIDILYVHWWDWTTSIPELMDSLHMLVEQGKVLYLGASDTPAWVVSAANTYALAHAKTPFCVYQGQWNILSRDFERDIIPMARHFGMALCPWNVLGGGHFQTEEQLQARRRNGEGIRKFEVIGQTEDERRASVVLEKIASEIGSDVSITTVALAYVLHKARYVYPLVGGRKTHHLDQNIKALEISLSDAQISELESVKPFDVGFPMNFTLDDPKETGITPKLMAASAPMAWQRNSLPIIRQ